MPKQINITTTIAVYQRHLHSALQDATNLAWKVAAVVAGDAVAGPQLLETYHEEMWPVGAAIIRRTGQVQHEVLTGQAPDVADLTNSPVLLQIMSKAPDLIICTCCRPVNPWLPNSSHFTMRRLQTLRRCDAAQQCFTKLLCAHAALTGATACDVTACCQAENGISPSSR